MATTSAKATRTEPAIGDDAVREKTGRTWAQWVRALDAAGARDLSHREIARLVRERFGAGSWWNQMVTVGYEQITGRRARLQTARGFSATASLTIPADIEHVFDVAAGKKRATGWLPRGIIVHRATRPKSLRATAPDGRKSVSVSFYARGAGRTQVAVEQGKLASQADALRVKKQWATGLRKLDAACRTPRAGTRTASRDRTRKPPSRK
jgi:hypothetical protein